MVYWEMLAPNRITELCNKDLLAGPISPESLGKSGIFLPDSSPGLVLFGNWFLKN